MKKYGKYTLLGWSWRTLMWVVLTPILLFLLLSIIIYLPPVQKWAVDKACESLSEEMGMEVTVEDICLKFPLDLSMGGMVAVQEGDTVLRARTLDVNVKAMPLFDGLVEVDGITLKDTKLNTRQLVEACVVRGTVGEVSLDSHSTDLKSENAVVNKALISDADLTVVLSDSVPEDTTQSEPVNWRVRLDDVELRRVKTTVWLTPSADSVWMRADIDKGKAKAMLDLGKGLYRIENFCLNDTRVGTAMFAENGMKDLHIVKAEGAAVVDGMTVDVPKLSVLTEESQLAASYKMDMNAFADSVPGTFKAVAKGQIGKDDILYFARMGGESAKDARAMLSEWLPAQPVQVALKAEGNMDELQLSDVHIGAAGLATVDAEATLWDVVNDLSLKADAKADVGRHGAKVRAKGSYVMASEAYKAEVDFKNVVVNEFVKMDEQLVLNGNAKASGKGFDFLAEPTVMDATVALNNSRYGKVNLSSINADAKVKGNRLNLDLSCDNNQLRTDFNLDGTLTKRLLSGVLNIDLPYVDVKGMGFSDERLTASTKGVMDFNYDWKKNFRVESNIDALQLLIGEDSITTDAFYLFAEAEKDTTAATFRTGDLDFDFFTPNNILNLQPQLNKILTVMQKQAKERAFDINVWKTYYPYIHLHATAGTQNPVAQILQRYGMRFNEFVADAEISPDNGIVSNGHVYAFKSDSIMIDTAFFSIMQDSTHLDLHAGVNCQQQELLPAFKAYLDGKLGMRDADVHLTYLNDKNETGIDLGVKAEKGDSCHILTLYPKQPTIGFRRFVINDDNFITLHKERPVVADIRLHSIADSSYIALTADESEMGEQQACAVVKKLNIADWLTVIPIPGLPKMAGLLNLDADYLVEEDKFTVKGVTDIENFAYEDMIVGNVGGTFNYMPNGMTAHDIAAELTYNGTAVADMVGTYDTADSCALRANATLTDIPMSMISPFIPDQIVNLTGWLGGKVKVNGPTDALLFSGFLLPKDVHLQSAAYSLDLALANDSIMFDDSRLTFNSFNFYGADKTPLALNGYVDFSNLDLMRLSLSLYGQNFKLIEAKRKKKAVLFGEMYGDFFARVNGTTNDLSMRGLVRVLPTTDITYIMTETPLSQGDRLDDIVTFVDFSQPADTTDDRTRKSIMGIDMNMVLNIEDGAQFHCEFSADKQSYVNVQGGGSVTMTYTPEGVLNLQGRYTINEGEMKYTLPVIPLRTFTIANGSYIEFTGDPANPTLNIAATERTRATVGQSDGTSRSVAFDAGLKISNSLENMGLEFTIAAPEDLTVQSELESMGAEERNKMAVAMLATGMYLSSSNSKGFTATNALNAFLQNEINNIAGRAFSTLVNVDVGMEQTTRDNGTTRTDYSFKFSRRFFSDRLNVVIGGKVSADGDKESNESGAYIDDVSLEWRLDNGGTQYVRLFHEKDYSNLIEGELDKNGAGVLLKKKVDKFSDLYFWRKRKEEK